MMIDAGAIAVMIGLNPNHVRDRLTKRADFPRAYRLGGSLRWKIDDVRDWIDAQQLKPAARRQGKTRRATTRQAAGEQK